MSVPGPVIGGVQCTIRFEDLGADALTEAYPQSGGQTAKVLLKCPWPSRRDVLFALLGGIDGQGARQPPLQYPYNDRLFCLSASQVTGIGPRIGGDGWPLYNHAVIAAEFGAPPYQFTPNPPNGPNDPSGSPWTTCEIKASSEVVTPPGGTYYIGPFTGPTTTKKAAEASVGIVVPNVEVSLGRKMLPSLPLDELLAFEGTLNSDPIQIADHYFEKGCLLCVAVEHTPAFDPFGTPCFDLAYTMLGRDYDFNKVIADDGSDQFLNTDPDGNGDFPYQYEDFSNLP
jgi:hypothetical protein